MRHIFGVGFVVIDVIDTLIKVLLVTQITGMMVLIATKYRIFLYSWEPIMTTITLLGKVSPNRYVYTWSLDAQELGYQTKPNDLNGLTKDDIIIIDRQTKIDLKSSPAKKYSCFPT